MKSPSVIKSYFVRVLFLILDHDKGIISPLFNAFVHQGKKKKNLINFVKMTLRFIDEPFDVEGYILSTLRLPIS